MERIRFCELFSDDLFQKLSDYLDRHGLLTETKHFILFNDLDSEDFSIIYKDMLDPIIISWYKFNHIGRGLNLIGIEDETKLINMLDMLEKDLNEDIDRLDKTSCQ